MKNTRVGSVTAYRRRLRPGASAKFSGSLFRRRPWLEVMENRTLLSTLLVTSTADSGTGSLRQAILDSNAATAGANTIITRITIAIATGITTITASLSATRLRTI